MVFLQVSSRHCCSLGSMGNQQIVSIVVYTLWPSEKLTASTGVVVIIRLAPSLFGCVSMLLGRPLGNGHFFHLSQHLSLSSFKPLGSVTLLNGSVFFHGAHYRQLFLYSLLFLPRPLFCKINNNNNSNFALTLGANHHWPGCLVIGSLYVAVATIP